MAVDLLRRVPAAHLLAAALCAGLALALLGREAHAGLALTAAGAALVAVFVAPARTVLFVRRPRPRRALVGKRAAGEPRRKRARGGDRASCARARGGDGTGAPERVRGPRSRSRLAFRSRRARRACPSRPAAGAVAPSGSAAGGRRHGWAPARPRDRGWLRRGGLPAAAGHSRRAAGRELPRGRPPRWPRRCRGRAAPRCCALVGGGPARRAQGGPCGGRPGRGRGARPGAARPFQGVRPLPPARRLGPERRLRRRRDDPPGVDAGVPALDRGGRGPGCGLRLRPRGGLAALRRAGGGRRRPRLARLARLAPARPLVLPARRRGRAARVEPVQPARARVPALVRGRRRHLRARSPNRGQVGRLPAPGEARRRPLALRRVRRRDRSHPLAALRGDPRLLARRQRPGGADRRAAPRPRARRRGSPSRPARGRRRPRLDRQLAGRVPRSVRAPRRRAAVRPGRVGSRASRPPRRDGPARHARPDTAPLGLGAQPLAPPSRSPSSSPGRVRPGTPRRSRTGCGSPCSTSARATRSCCRSRRAPSSSTRARRRRTSPASSKDSASNALQRSSSPILSATTSAAPPTCSRSSRSGAVLDPRLPAESADHDAAAAAARARDVSVVTVRAGQRLRVGALRLEVLWPDGPGPPGDDPNNHAVVLLARYGQVDALLTADAEGNVTVPIRPPPVEILKVAHHGSADAALPALLELVDPQIAVVSVGRDNDYGHPTPSTMAALAGLRGPRRLPHGRRRPHHDRDRRAAHLGLPGALTMLGRSGRGRAPSHLSPHRRRPSEDSTRARAPPRPLRAGVGRDARGRRCERGGGGRGLQLARPLLRRGRPARARGGRRELEEGRRGGGRRLRPRSRRGRGAGARRRRRAQGLVPSRALQEGGRGPHVRGAEAARPALLGQGPVRAPRRQGRRRCRACARRHRRARTRRR